MSNTARKRILERLRAGREGLAAPEADFTVIDEHQWDREEKIRRFVRMMEAVNGEVHLCEDSSFDRTLTEIVTTRKLDHIFYGKDTELGPRLEAIREANNGFPLLATVDGDSPDHKQAMFAAPAAITTTLGGIAQTGSLILWGTPSEPRLLSLAPNVHIAVLYADKLYNTLLEAMRNQGWAGKMPTNALLISGPSKTADIEQILTYGVHGPRELIVLLVK
ncbi:MAG: lactate utilization protein [Gammaproteobacteria bacterium]|nr:lactate utilization protein [Gammaproteobacteria bacterium]